MDVNRLSSISQADTEQKMGEFWDTHDFTDFDSDTPDVEFEVVCSVPIEMELFRAIKQQAEKQGMTVEALVNLWLQQKLTEQSA